MELNKKYILNMQYRKDNIDIAERLLPKRPIKEDYIQYDLYNKAKKNMKVVYLEQNLK